MATRSIKRYRFVSQYLEELRTLGTFASDPWGFQSRHGKLLNILNLKFDEGVLKTLVQFYNHHYHCFMFPDYLLLPALEEYAHLVGLPVLNRVPYSGLEEVPKALAIAKALCLKLTDITSNLATKGKKKTQGVTAGFLIGKAKACIKAKSTHAFETILALLIYGLVLFPTYDGFVDANAIQIFLTKNPVPTLLGDTYHSIHHRNEQQGGLILCCAPLLYQYSERIMSLTPTDVVWYNPTYDTGTIIDNCGEFNNVPLLGMRGGISYNPVLARRQFGYPLKNRPLNIHLENVYYHNQSDSKSMRNQIVRARHTIHKKNSNQLGEKSNLTFETYTQWIIDETARYQMPYPLPRYLSSTTPELPLPLPPTTQEKYREKLDDLNRECNTWKKKYEEEVAKVRERDMEIALQNHALLRNKQKIIELNAVIQEEDALLNHGPARKKRQGAFFASSCSHPSP